MNLNFTLASRYLIGRKLRTILTTISVMFGVLVLFGMNIILPTMLEALQANALAASGQVDLTITHVSTDAFPQDVLAKVTSVNGVRAASASLNRTVNLPLDFFDGDPKKADVVTAVSLVGVDPFAANSVRIYPVTTGRYLKQDDPGVAVITQSLADSLSVKVGDVFSIPSTNGLAPLTVVGILPPRTMPGNEEVLVTLAQAQEMSGQSGKINAIDIALNSTDEARRAEITKNIETALGDLYKLGSLAAGSEMFASLKLGQAAFSLFGVLALFMGAFIIFNTFRTVVAERRRDIGMLRAVGASRRTIVGLILAEGLLQGIIGTAAGLLIGYLLGAGVIALAGPLMTQFLNLKMGSPVVSPGIIGVSILLGVGVTVLAGLLPALNASKVTPLEALRPSLAEAEFKRQTGRGFIVGIVLVVLAVLAIISQNTNLIGLGALLFLVGLVLVAPALVHPIARVFGALIALVYARHGTGELAQGNLTRQPSRVAVTASATMLGLAIVVAAGGMVSSLTITLFDIMRKNFGSDYLFIPPSVALWASNLGANEGFADRLSALDSVASVSTLRFAGSTVNGMSVSLMGIDPVQFPQVTGLRFSEGDESAYSDLAAGRAMIANGAFTSAMGVKVGDTVELATPNGKVPYHLVAVASDLLNAKITTAFISQAVMKADFGTTEDVFIQLNLNPGADSKAAEAQIRQVASDFPQFKIVAGKAYYDQMKAIMNAAFSAMYLMLALLALPSLIAMFNTLAIGVIERTREIGMLRAVGATRKQVRTTVLAEALLLASIGTAFGLLGGLYLGYLFVIAMSPIFPMGYAFPFAGILSAIAIGLIFGAFAAIVPARQAARMEIVAALHYE